MKRILKWVWLSLPIILLSMTAIRYWTFIRFALLQMLLDLLEGVGILIGIIIISLVLMLIE